MALPDSKTKLASRRWRALGWLCKEIAGLPRHLSQHPGGMVISSRPLVELVPVVPAAMEGRQLCQWDKDSCADAGFLKIDLLGLGMLSAIEDCVERIAPRAARRSTSRASRSTTRVSTGRSRRPTLSARSRSRAVRRCRACCARAPRTWTTSLSSCPRTPGTDPGRCPPAHRPPCEAAHRSSPHRVRPSAAGGRARGDVRRRRLPVTRCWRWPWRWPGSRSARRRGCDAR